jgi:hypothetical protein
MVYDRQIKYFDYIVKNEKVKAAGFVKTEVMDGLCMMQIHIDGMPTAWPVLRNVILCSAEKESVAAAIQIDNGKGDTGVLELKTYGLGDNEISYFDLEEIIIPLDTEKFLRCIWRGKEAAKEPLKEPTKELRKEESKEESKELTTEDIAVEEQTEELKAAHITSDEICRSSMYKDNKWECLAGMYEHGNILGEMADSLVIRPADFVIMPEKYYKLAGNSFLLHGYHNYGYVLLVKMEKRKETQYYIAVPGNYYEKEKDAAIMFGFEGFECGSDYVHTGDFGYYMVSVEL